MGPAWNNFAPIAREGLKFIFISLVFFVVSILAFDMWVVPTGLFLLTAFLCFFFRNPERLIPVDADAILSPADGKVMIAHPIQDPSGTQKYKIAIFLSIFNVHINRSPVAGTIQKILYHPGKFAMAFRHKESELNERNEIVIETDASHRVTMIQIAGWVARRIVCYLKELTFVNAGDRIGLIQFGSRVDLIIEGPITPHIKVGDHVKGGSTVLAHFIRTPERESIS